VKEYVDGELRRDRMSGVMAEKDVADGGSEERTLSKAVEAGAFIVFFVTGATW